MLEGLQKLGRALMLPIAVLPAAAIILRLGAPDVLAVPFMAAAGEAVFANLPLIFAVGVAVGFAGSEQGAAALAAAAGYLVFKAALTTLDKSIDMGVLAGILMGLTAAYAANRQHLVRLPKFLAFFGGSRFTPIAAALAGLALAPAFAVLYPPVQAGLRAASDWLTQAGALGAFVFGTLNRLLIPTGLHHIVNSVVWFQFGEFAGPNGTVAHGDLHRFFAGDPTAGTYMAGFFPVMIFGLPAACLAMIRRAAPDKRARAAGLLAGAALTAMVTGVTEPVEFAFMFLAPGLYLVHALLTGLSLALCALLGIKMGFGFSAGAIDYALNYGLGTRAWLIAPIGAVFFIVYYLLFDACIRIFDLKTPGRENDTTPDATAGQPSPAAGEAGLAVALAAALGGPENLIAISACITRLRLTLADPELADRQQLAALGASGTVRVGDKGLQVVLGPRSEAIAKQMRELTGPGAKPGPDAVPASGEPSPANAKPASELPRKPSRPTGPTEPASPTEPAAQVKTDVALPDDELETIFAPMDGDIVALENVPDEVFASKTVGEGLAVAPASGRVVAPANGTIGSIAATNHAFSLLTASGAELFVHVGIDTVKLDGAGFTRLANPGDRVKTGDPVLEADLSLIARKAPSALTPVVVANADEFGGLRLHQGTVRAGQDPVFAIIRKKER